MGISLSKGRGGPMGVVDAPFSMGLDALKLIPVRPFQWREFLEPTLSVTLLVSLAVYGSNGNFNRSG